MTKSNKKILGSGLTSLDVRIKLIEHLRKQGINNKIVLEMIKNMPRHLFIETALKDRAYENTALPIGYNQTISQPYIVGKMTQLIIENDNMENVLEIGTGSGYQTAILASIFKEVITIERIKPLYTRTSTLLKKMGFKNIKCLFGDGFKGSIKNSPYDAILMTAAPTEIPKDLIKQLKENGRMILPLDDKGKQNLLRIKNTKNGILKKIIDDVVFVPMIEGIVE
ncbi:MAG: protein-L-isoaspartate(D-aspartate) O-methyltransferase [Pseudomonadota bacterium]|nr:protein-L-isoaspartate(D-aspartate) O-methyltransferase [Pseudomonadota bacterium]